MICSELVNTVIVILCDSWLIANSLGESAILCLFVSRVLSSQELACPGDRAVLLAYSQHRQIVSLLVCAVASYFRLTYLIAYLLIIIIGPELSVP